MKFFVLFAFVTAVYGSVVPEPRAGFIEENSFNSRIVGGQEAPPHSAPYIVSLKTELGYHFCAGSIIGPKTIVTAAHCLIIDEFFVDAGIHAVAADDEYSKSRQLINVERFIIHEEYDGGVGPFDIGLIFLKEELKLNNNDVASIKFPRAETIHQGNVTLHGWGNQSGTTNPSMPLKLQTVTKPIIPFADCKALIPSAPLHVNNVCTGPVSGGVSACSGDSGGPLVQKNSDGQLELVGIVSWGYIPCGTVGRPSVYTRTSAYNDWVILNDIYNSPIV